MNNISRKKVLLVDDHAVLRKGLAALINGESDMETCGEADTERSALEAVHRFEPDVAVVDWSLGTKDAAELVGALRMSHPQIPVLVLSMHDEVFYAERALHAGARGYVMKQEAGDRIIGAIRAVLDGGSYLSEKAARVVKDSVNWRRSGVGARPASGIVNPKPARTQDAEPDFDRCFVSIVIPVFNSEATIERLVASLIAALNRSYRLQIVLVDDGSTDRSAEICRGIQNRDSEMVDFVSLSRNFGEHNAVMAGLNCVDGDYCVVMDDDFQNPASEVRKLVEEIRKGFDVVYVRYERKNHSWFRNVGSRFANWVATRTLGKPAGLYLSSFKAMNRFMVREAVIYTGSDPHLDAIILRSTRKISVVPARHEPRGEGKSGYTLYKLGTLWGNLVIPFSLYPLRLLGIYGIVFTLIGVGYWVYNFIANLSPSFADPTEIDNLHASLWFFRGIQSLAIALVGEYVGRIHRQMNREPQFIVRDVLRRRSGPRREVLPPPDNS